MLFTNVAIFLLVVYFCVAQQLNDKEVASAESSKENARRFHPNGKNAGRRWAISRNGPYKRVVSSAEHDVPDTKDEENNTTETTEESEESKEKSKKIKLLTPRTHQQNVTESDNVKTNNTRHYIEVSRSRGHKDYSGAARRRRISTESELEYSTQSSNKRRRMPTIPTTTNVPQTMSYSLYNYFRPLEQDVPQDDILPFLDFGRKLSPAAPTPSGFNSIENKSTVGRFRIHVTEPSVTPTDDEVVHEEMDLSFDRRVIERNSVPRGRLHASPIISNLYRKPNTQTTRTSDNLVITSDCITGSHNGQKKHSRTQEQQIESRKNRSICASQESDTVIKKADVESDDTGKQTLRKINDVEVISDIKLPYKSSELKRDDLKSRSAIAAEPSNVKAIFKDVQGSDLFNSNAKLNFTINATDTTDTSTTTVPNTKPDGNALKSKERLSEVEATMERSAQELVRNSTVLIRSDNVDNTTKMIIQEEDQTAFPLKNNKVYNKTTENKENSYKISNVQNKNNLKALPSSNTTMNNTNVINSQNSSKTRDRLFQVKPIIRSHFRHPALSKKALHAPLSQLRVLNTTQSNDTLNDITKPETKALSKQNITNITDNDTADNRSIPLKKEVETPSPIVTTSTPDSPKSKILSTAVVTSISVHESSNSSVSVTEMPLVNNSNSKLNVPEPLPLSLQESPKQTNVTTPEVVKSNNEIMNVEEKLTNEALTTGHETTTTLPPPTTTTDIFANYTSTKASAVDSVTNSTLIKETTTDNIVTTTVETTSLIPTEHYLLPNVTLNNPSDVIVEENPVLTVNDTKRPDENQKSTMTPETTAVPNSETPETINTEENVLYDPTITPVITAPPEEVTLPREDDLSSVLPTAVSNSTFIPSDKDSATDLEAAIVKEEKNNISVVSSAGNLSKVHEQKSLAVPDNNKHKDVEIAYQEGIGITTYILVFLGVVPIVLGAMVAGRFLVLHSRKKVLDESEYSSEYNRSPLAIGAASPLPTKLPRVPTHLGWEVEKSTPTILPTTSARWEFPREKLRLQTLLGQGNFGQVWKAEADDISGHEGLTRLVAVKTVKESANTREREDLLRELGIMQDLGSHPNVVTLLGCCTEKEPYFLIMEYVMYGKLLAFLRDHRTRAHYYNFSDVTDALTSRDLTVFAYCVARGMDYLSNKGIIHRDLAARNILVDHNKLCKIADFGMSRNVRDTGQIYEQRQSKGALPIRWMAPESLHFSLFTQKSDVWSFGILMWEIVTLGSTPYATMGAREVMRRVRDGYRLERPSHCRMEFFRVISRCWHSDPNKRPTFSELKQEIGQLLGDSENGGGYVDLESLADEIKQGMHNSSSLQRKH